MGGCRLPAFEELLVRATARRDVSLSRERARQSELRKRNERPARVNRGMGEDLLERGASHGPVAGPLVRPRAFEQRDEAVGNPEIGRLEGRE
jgi:hypothetical protein